MDTLSRRKHDRAEDLCIGVEPTAGTEYEFPILAGSRELHVDWGDGSDEEIIRSTGYHGAEVAKHTYPSTGKFMVRIWPVSALTQVSYLVEDNIMQFSDLAAAKGLTHLELHDYDYEYFGGVLTTLRNFTGLQSLDLSDCGFSEGEVDAILAELVAGQALGVYLYEFPTVDLTTNTAPSVAGAADAATLVGAGWAVSVDV